VADRAPNGHVSPIESVDRALRVMAVLGEEGGGFTLEELVERLDLPKSSIHRTLAALKFREFVVQQGDGGRYLLGTGLLSTAFGFYERMDVRALAHPLLIQLRDEFNETAHMAVLDGPAVVYLDKVESSHSIKLSSTIGGRNPAHATGVGKALLAWTYPTEQALDEWIGRSSPLESRTPGTITAPAELAAELATTRSRGYAIDLEESEWGVRCLAMPIFFGRPVPAAAVSIAAPRNRLSTARIRQIGPRFQRLVQNELAPWRHASA
jgi:IclR family transcriptional regulator, acetate operon repressor